MEQFLNETRIQLVSQKYTTLNIVLGNESCDLDSAVSAIVYAAFLRWQYLQIKCKVCTKEKRDESTYKDEAFVPVLNVDRADFEIKTEVAYCLKLAGIEASSLVFRDDFDLKHLIQTNPSNVVLVDHHILASADQHFTSKVTEIIDHRPQDKLSWSYKEDVRSTIEQVGSCASLVASRIRALSALLKKETDFFSSCPVGADLLHSTIILDTVNFSKEVNKGRPKDEEMVLFLEEILKPDNVAEFRISKLENLVRARKDVSKLSAQGLLKKDAKVIGDVFVPSFPVLVEQLLKMDSAKQAIEAILCKNNCTIALLLGMKLDGGLERDAAIYSTEQHKERARQLSRILQEWTSPRLELSEAKVNIQNCVYYKQLNKAASRKQYVPAVNELISK